tara:strand:+ start:13409 stop:13621 length:213 start_codon:yes stop_codon:yes gene_type:complete
MSLRLALKKQGTVRGRRWIVKRNTDTTIKEVKCIFNPDEYETMKRAKPMFGDRALIKILDKNYEESTRDK